MPKRMIAAVAGVLASLLWPAGVAAADGDAQRGLEKAREVCAHCHVVEEGGSGNAALPSFPAIAKDPATDDSRLRAWQSPPHPQMPQFGSLTEQDVADIVAYIESLETE